MQQGSLPKHTDVGFRHAEHPRNEDGGTGDAHGMPMSERGLGVDHFAESLTDFIDGGFAPGSISMTRQFAAATSLHKAPLLASESAARTRSGSNQLPLLFRAASSA